MTRSGEFPIFAASRIYPRGWVRIGGFRDDAIPADREAFDRLHGCGRHASDTLKSARPGGLGAAATGGASNRSRKCVVSFAPLGHSFSGGLFFHLLVGTLRVPGSARGACGPRCREDRDLFPHLGTAFGNSLRRVIDKYRRGGVFWVYLRSAFEAVLDHREKTSHKLPFRGVPTMRRFLLTLFSFALWPRFLLAAPLSSARAAFTALGDILPADPSVWTSSTNRLHRPEFRWHCDSRRRQQPCLGRRLPRLL